MLDCVRTEFLEVCDGHQLFDLVKGSVGIGSKVLVEEEERLKAVLGNDERIALEDHHLEARLEDQGSILQLLEPPSDEASHDAFGHGQLLARGNRSEESDGSRFAIFRVDEKETKVLHDR